jgi:RNA polymerase sigma-70 factor (ECF subfamily)
VHCRGAGKVEVSLMMTVPPGSSAEHGPGPAGRAPDPQPDLAELLRASARGHEDAFAALYDRTSARIYGIVLRVLRSPDQAAEVTQEVYVEVWRQAARYQPEKGGVLAWMATMAHRRAIDRVRSVSSETARDQRYALQEAIPAQDNVWTRVEQRLDVERVRRGMSALTGIQREAIVLSYFGGYTQTQVASLLDLPLGTVKTRIRDGLIRLRDALGVEL